MNDPDVIRESGPRWQAMQKTMADAWRILVGGPNGQGGPFVGGIRDEVIEIRRDLRDMAQQNARDMKDVRDDIHDLNVRFGIAVKLAVRIGWGIVAGVGTGTATLVLNFANSVFGLWGAQWVIMHGGKVVGH